jgi:LysM repeat protein
MDYKIVIDPGHGGIDSGASGNGIVEKNLTLDISKYMYDRFKELGVPVSITRLDDSTLSPSDRVDKILGFYGDDPNVIVISNHINAGRGDGAEVIYALRNDSRLADMIGVELGKAGQNFRRSYQRRLPSNINLDYYFIHRNTGNTEPIIVEYGFLDSSKDDVSQLKNDYESFSDAVVKAVLDYIGYDYGSDIYIVQKGDSLWSIARKYGISVSELKRLNGLNSNLLSVGQVLKVKGDSDSDVYVVKSGDTLYGIANSYGLGVSELKEFNGLNSNLISIGQELLIPSSRIYVVEKGDTLYSISKKYDLDVKDLMKYNNLNSNLLSIGQVLRIPS